MGFKKGQMPWNRIESNSLCNYCGKIFHIAPSKLKDKKIKRGVFCSRQCSDDAKRGKAAWNKGLKGTQGANGGSFSSIGRKFTGSQKGYLDLHYRMRKAIKKPNNCQKCNQETNKLDLSNISGKYIETLSDWQYLCRKCHYEFDEVELRRNKNAKGSNKPSLRVNETG